MSTVLGIDVGGTKTVCLLGDEEGRIVATGRGQGANLQAVGEPAFENVLHQVMEETIGDRPAPAAICLGIAGVDRPDDEAVVHRVMSRIGYKARILVVNDALIALQAAVGDAAGIVIISGTGSIAFGRDPTGRAARAGGWGHILGDEGSGYWIGRLALGAVMRQADGRSTRTALTDLVLKHFGVARAEEMISIVYRQDLKASEIATLAAYVQQAREEGDPAAGEILERGANELAATGAAVARQLDMIDQPFTWVLAGGMFNVVPALRERLMRALPGIARRSTALHLVAEPALGAVRLALAALRGRARLPEYER